MPIYLDLHPTPQFDRSLVQYCVINFEKIRDALRFAGKQVRFETFAKGGPWGEPPSAISQSVYVPYRADVVIWSEISFYTTASNYAGRRFRWDGVQLPIIAEIYCNEANSHKKVSATNTVRNVAAGVHVYSSESWYQFVVSDSGDYWRMHFTYYEL